MDEIRIEKGKLLDSFNLLSLDEQRNEFNGELSSLCILVNKLLDEYDTDKRDNPIIYRKNIDYQKSEKEVLLDNYSNLLDLKNNIILLLSYMDKNR